MDEFMTKMNYYKSLMIDIAPYYYRTRGMQILEFIWIMIDLLNNAMFYSKFIEEYHSQYLEFATVEKEMKVVHDLILFRREPRDKIVYRTFMGTRNCPVIETVMELIPEERIQELWIEYVILEKKHKDLILKLRRKFLIMHGVNSKLKVICSMDDLTYVSELTTVPFTRDKRINFFESRILMILSDYSRSELRKLLLDCQNMSRLERYAFSPQDIDFVLKTNIHELRSNLEEEFLNIVGHLNRHILSLGPRLDTKIDDFEDDVHEECVDYWIENNYYEPYTIYRGMSDVLYIEDRPMMIQKISKKKSKKEKKLDKVCDV